jgi:two-component system cell cycle sensor histidine kinase/response regulator CckA
MKKKTILVVDDEKIIRDLLSRILDKLGYNVIIAEDGRQAMDIFKKRNADIDLVIIDLLMPEMNGRETTAGLKAINPDVAILLSSGQAETATTTTGGEAAVDGFLSKPYRVSQLAEAIEKVIDSDAMLSNNERP